MEQSEKTLDMIVNLCKNRGYVFPGSEIYGGLANSWDYGPLGVEFKNNVKKAWLKKFVQESPYNVGLDAAIIMNPQTWVTTGHVSSFSDPLLDCRACKARHRADKLIGEEHPEVNVDAMSFDEMDAFIAEHEDIVCPVCGKHDFTPIRKFNLMFKTAIGVTEDMIALLNGERRFDATVPVDAEATLASQSAYAEDFADVKGQTAVKRALEIAAAGGHNVLMIGAPGSGKTMLARRMPTILPPLSVEEALETTKIHSVAGKLGAERGLLSQRPFRAPHHMTSQVALIGGGQSPQPGEVSLAHNGVLFLDELPEFGRSVLEVLRQPLEDKKIMVSRARYSVEYPANFTLVAAMNPCPCGYYNHPTKECTCPPGAVHRYMGRISGPLLDRIDLQVEVTPVAIGEISQVRPSEPSAAIRERVIRAREVQAERFRGVPGVHTNAMMNARMLREFCPLDQAARELLERAMVRLDLSARAYDRIVKVARTIADLEGTADIGAAHLAEAINYRSLDRGSWGR